MTKRMTGLSLTFGGMLALGGCIVADGGRDGDSDRYSRSVDYRCDDDRRFSARFDDDRATVRAGDRAYRLDLEDRGRGSRQYGDGDVQLFVSRDSARLRIKDERDYSDCEER